MRGRCSIKLSWVLLFFMAGAWTVAFAQSNPVPLINQPLVPLTVKPGSQSFTLTVNGTGFVSGAVVNWNGAPLTTTFVSGFSEQRKIGRFRRADGRTSPLCSDRTIVSRSCVMGYNCGRFLESKRRCTFNLVGYALPFRGALHIVRCHSVIVPK